MGTDRCDHTRTRTREGMWGGGDDDDDDDNDDEDDCANPPPLHQSSSSLGSALVSPHLDLGDSETVSLNGVQTHRRPVIPTLLWEYLSTVPRALSLGI